VVHPQGWLTGHSRPRPIAQRYRAKRGIPEKEKQAAPDGKKCDRLLVLLSQKIGMFSHRVFALIIDFTLAYLALLHVCASFARFACLLIELCNIASTKSSKNQGRAYVFFPVGTSAHTWNKTDPSLQKF